MNRLSYHSLPKDDSGGNCQIPRHCITWADRQYPWVNLLVVLPHDWQLCGFGSFLPSWVPGVFLGLDFFFFGQVKCGALVPWPGIEPVPSTVEAWSLNHGPPGKSLFFFYFSWVFLDAAANYKNLTCFTLLFHFSFRASGCLSIYSAWFSRTLLEGNFRQVLSPWWTAATSVINLTLSLDSACLLAQRLHLGSFWSCWVGETLGLSSGKHSSAQLEEAP